MLDIETLISKKNKYEAQLNEIQSTGYPEDIEVKVAEYRAQLQCEYDKSKKEDINALNHYISLLTELITENQDTTVIENSTPEEVVTDNA